MQEDSSTIGWNLISKDWCELIEANDPNNPGYFIMPYTLEQLGDVSGKKILDLGSARAGIRGNLREGART